MKLLTWMGVDRGVLSDNDTDHLLRLVFIYTGKKSESRLCDFMCNNKGQFRDQMTIIHRARAHRDPKIALNAFDPADTELVKNLSAELGFKDEWLVFEEQTTEDQNQQQIPEFMQRMQSFMGRFSGKRKASSSPKSEKKPYHKLGRTAPGQGLKEYKAALKNAAAAAQEVARKEMKAPEATAPSAADSAEESCDSDDSSEMMAQLFASSDDEGTTPAGSAAAPPTPPHDPAPAAAPAVAFAPQAPAAAAPAAAPAATPAAAVAPPTEQVAPSIRAPSLENQGASLGGPLGISRLSGPLVLPTGSPRAQGPAGVGASGTRLFFVLSGTGLGEGGGGGEVGSERGEGRESRGRLPSGAWHSPTHSRQTRLTPALAGEDLLPGLSGGWATPRGTGHRGGGEWSRQGCPGALRLGPHGASGSDPTGRQEGEEAEEGEEAGEEGGKGRK